MAVYFLLQNMKTLADCVTYSGQTSSMRAIICMCIDETHNEFDYSLTKYQQFLFDPDSKNILDIQLY